MIARLEMIWANHLMRTSRRLRRKAGRIHRRSGEALRMAENHYKRLGVDRFGK